MSRREATTRVEKAWTAADHPEPEGINTLRTFLHTRWPELYDALQELAHVDHLELETEEEYAERLHHQLEKHRREVLTGPTP